MMRGGPSVCESSAQAQSAGTRSTSAPAAPFASVSSFGVDADGELYVCDYLNGRILKIIGPPAAPAAPAGLRIVR